MIDPKLERNGTLCRVVCGRSIDVVSQSSRSKEAIEGGWDGMKGGEIVSWMGLEWIT